MLRFSLLAALCAALIVFSGCGGVLITSQPAQQVGGPGSDVKITVSMCSSGSSCGNSNTNAGGSRALMAFRIPDGSRGPNTFQRTGGTVTNANFQRNASYTQQLTTLVPPPAGQHWEGYISDTLSEPGGAPGPDSTLEVAPGFTLPDGATSYRYRAVAGLTDTPSGTDPDCGSDPYALNVSGTPPHAAVCIDSPDPATTVTNLQIATTPRPPDPTPPADQGTTTPQTTTTPQGTPSAPRTGATVSSTGPGGLLGDKLDTGLTVTCPSGLPVNCGGGGHASTGITAVDRDIARYGFSVPTGKSLPIKIPLTREGRKLLKRVKSLQLKLKVITRNAAGQRVTTGKTATIKP